MKKILALLVLTIAMVSCYEEYLLDYPYTATYFYLQQDVRTFVVGEGMKFKVGVTMGGIRENNIDRNIGFALDPSLITPARLASMKITSQGYIKDAVSKVSTLEQLPAAYYTLSSPNTMVIKAGSHTGTVTVKADSLSFTNDSLKTTRMSSYVLPFKITAWPTIDSIIKTKTTNVVGTMIENMLFGKYWHGGAALVNRPAKADTTFIYKTAIPTLNENLIWTLTTLGPSTLAVSSYYKNAAVAGDTIMHLTLKGSKVFVSSGPDAPFVITPDGESTFNRARLLQDRKVFLKYKFTDGDGNTYHCTDTIRFRNRIRDGINEWQDENPSNYDE